MEPDELKGRVEEAAGDLTDDEELKRKGKRDQLIGKAKDAAERAAEKAKQTAERASEKAKEFLDRTKED